MQSAVIGFPRVGKLRELKFASEKYFRGEIDNNELSKAAKDLRKEHWTWQKEAGIDYISSNDFSLSSLVNCSFSYLESTTVIRQAVSLLNFSPK